MSGHSITCVVRQIITGHADRPCRRRREMVEHSLTIDRDIEEIEQQVRRELDTIQDLLISTGYRASMAGWNTPYHLHRLRRALRIHYLALKIREGTPLSNAADEMAWDLRPDTEC